MTFVHVKTMLWSQKVEYIIQVSDKIYLLRVSAIVIMVQIMGHDMVSGFYVYQ